MKKGRLVTTEIKGAQDAVNMQELFAKVVEVHGIDATDLSKPAGRRVRAGGMRFRVLDWGGAGQPILFLHGGRQDALTWELVCLQLRSRYRCYAMDLRNHGQSDPSDDWLNPYVLADDVENVLAELRLERPALVGMSLGGLSAMAYASRHSDLRALVIVDVTPTITRERRAKTYAFMERANFKSFEEALDETAKLQPQRPRVHLEFTLRHMLQQQPDGTWARRTRREPAPDGLSASEARNNSQVVFETLWDEVPKIAAPTLVVHGEDSNATDYHDAERLARVIPNGRVVHIPDATHTVQGDKPKPLANEIDAFLKGLP